MDIDGHTSLTIWRAPISKRPEDAAGIIRVGGVVAYPTEYCFGLGCDPFNTEAIARILKIKRRSQAQGLILVAASVDQLRPHLEPKLFKNNVDQKNHATKYAGMLDAPRASWPGPVSWILPCHPRTSRWIRGSHSALAVRISAHPLVATLCRKSRMAIVSTSANHHGKRELRTTRQVMDRLGDQVDLILDGRCSGANAPSTLIDASSGRVIRGDPQTAQQFSHSSSFQ